MISNIDINSYRAYKNLLKTGKQASPNKKGKDSDLNVNSALLRNNYNDKLNNTKNLTKHIFSSQSKRFEWQTNEAINRHSELTGSLSNKRQTHLHSDNWQGFANLSQDEQSIKTADKYRK